MPENQGTVPSGEVNWDRYNLAVAMRDSGHVAEALDEIRKLTHFASDPNEKATLLANEVVCLRLMGRFEEAWGALKQAYPLVPECSPTYVFLGFHESRLLFDQLRGEEALRRVEGLLSHCADTLQELEAKDTYENLQSLRGILLVQLNRSAEARPILEAAASYEPAWDWVSYSLGLCYLDLGQLDEAKRRFREALDLGVSGALELRTHYRLGIIYFEQESHGWARQEFETCLSLKEERDPSRRNIYEWLAATCHALGQYDEAAKYSKLANQG
ncbi:MAG TPA: tetratricopeptide repeat protein [Candidatus Acidoferrales bacterium]|nr:tetratricopeptide repeat protein [Candidatus Acidoferrales bacterium]